MRGTSLARVSIRAALIATLGVTVGACASSGGITADEALRGVPLSPLAVDPEDFVEAAEGAYVHIDLDANLLRFMDGDQVVWEAPVGTGTGLRLRGEDGDWLFTTPTGVFEVKLKEEMPVWYLPDWYFVENNLPIPAQNDPSRRLTGQLGVAAVYIGEEIAIHGTDRPELLGQRVSHGCIRLENRFAQRLYHNVQIGTPIVIVGGEDIANEPLVDVPPRSGPRQEDPDPLAGVSTDDLLRRLGAALDSGRGDGEWVPLASRLITRGLRDDATALRGLLALAGRAEDRILNREYATFLADAYARGSLRVVVSLNRIEATARDRATRAIVDATMRLYAGSLDDPRAPWPTRRLHSGMLGPEGQAGWESLLAAEQGYRTRNPGIPLHGEAVTR